MMMLGFGLLMMLIVIGLPILLVALVLGGGAGLFNNHLPNISASVPQNQTSGYAPIVRNIQATPTPSRFCSHCGAGLQSDWTHCPQCGAPIQ